MADNKNTYLVKVVKIKHEVCVVEVEATDKEQAIEIALLSEKSDGVQIKVEDIQRLPAKK